jgi:glycosyltransferase involved in cell wall biosynthesis
MHILLLTPALPYPPHQGGALRNFGILRGLHDAGHQVSLLSFGTPGESSPLAALCTHLEIIPPPARTMRDRLRDLVTSGQPDLARRLESAVFREALNRLLSQVTFDLIQFEGLEMAIYMQAAHKLQPRARLIYDAHNAEFALQQAIAQVETGNPRRLPAALYSRIQARRIEHFERTVCAGANAVIAVSEEDAALLRPFRPDGRAHVLPNGIYVDDYSQPDSKKLDLGEHVLVFTGKMDYRPNVDGARWFADAILPRIHAQIPQARLYVVGQKPHASLQTLCEKEGIEVTGWVPEVQPFLHAAGVYVAPLRMGSGTRLKILEAMAAGCAVVATPIAAAGLNEDARRAIRLAEGEEAFAAAVIDLLRQPERRAELGAQAQRVVRQHYDWGALIPCLLNIYREV